MAQFGERPVQKNPLEYAGQKNSLIPTFDAPRAPTVLDRGYPIQTIWRDNTTNDEYILVDITLGNAIWQLLTGGVAGNITNLRADDGNIALPNVGVIDIDCNTVVSGTNPVPLYSTAAIANTIDLDVQVSSATAASNINDAGICSFDNAHFAVDANGRVQLAGGGLAIDQINVDANTAPGTDPVIPAATGEITIAGAAVAAHAVPLETHSRAANALNVEVQVASDSTGAPGNTNDAGICSFSDNTFVLDADGHAQLTPNTDAQLLIGNTAAGEPLVGDIISNTIRTDYTNPNIILEQESFYQEGHSNLGISYAGGTFTINPADGTALSATNRAFIRVRSKGTRNTFVTIPIIANSTFDDLASGTSDITGNLFGTTTTVAWNLDMPFFIYAVLNDAENAIAFMISRFSFVTISANIIGKPSSAIADAQGDWWALDDSITVGDYDANPCVLVGSFQMRKSGADDWTVQALAITDGIGLYQEQTAFQWPAGHNGAVAGSYFSQEGGGGTMPIWTTEATFYQVLRNGMCNMFWSGNVCTAAGIGAANLLIHPPFNVALGNYYNPPGMLSFLDTGLTARLQYYPYTPATGNNFFRFHDYNPAGSTALTPAGVVIGDSQFGFTATYRIIFANS